MFPVYSFSSKRLNTLLSKDEILHRLRALKQLLLQSKFSVAFVLPKVEHTSLYGCDSAYASLRSALRDQLLHWQKSLRSLEESRLHLFQRAMFYIGSTLLSI